MKEKSYLVDWYSGGFCYRSTICYTKEQVHSCKRTAKMLGDTIKVSIF